MLKCLVREALHVIIHVLTTWNSIVAALSSFTHCKDQAANKRDWRTLLIWKSFNGTPQSQPFGRRSIVWIQTKPLQVGDIVAQHFNAHRQIESNAHTEHKQSPKTSADSRFENDWETSTLPWLGCLKCRNPCHDWCKIHWFHRLNQPKPSTARTATPGSLSVQIQCLRMECLRSASWTGLLNCPSST